MISRLKNPLINSLRFRTRTASITSSASTARQRRFKTWTGKTPAKVDAFAQALVLAKAQSVKMAPFWFRTPLVAASWSTPLKTLSDNINLAQLTAHHGVWPGMKSVRRSEEHTSELQSVSNSYAVFCLKKKIQ